MRDFTVAGVAGDDDDDDGDDDDDEGNNSLMISASQRSNLWLGVRRPISTAALRNSSSTTKVPSPVCLVCHYSR